jgi:23S rRNA-/tRNA-specific pseudouridylate synthase
VKVTGKPLNQDSKPIITAYQTISHSSNTSELEVELVTGKTHQIRAHFA